MSNKGIEDFEKLFVGQVCQHSFFTYHVISTLLMEHGERIKSIIELGTGRGGLSMYLSLWAKRLGGIPMHTVDINAYAAIDDGLQPAFDLMDIKYHYMDMFSQECIDLVKGVMADGPTFLLCDGEDKPSEFQTFVPMAPPGSIVTAHDWGPSGHIRPDDVTEVVEQCGLVPYRYELGMLHNAQFGMWLKPAVPESE